MNARRNTKIALVVVAIHLIVLAFFFFKPPLNYFAVACVSTVAVWSAVFSVGKRRQRVAILTGWLIQVATQQVAYHAWVSKEAGVWWPLAQFLALQYVMMIRLNSSEES